MKRGNPVLRLEQFQASETARHADGAAGERGWKKQRLSGKPRDRAWNMAQRQNREASAPVKERADVQLVFRCERICGTFEDEKANDGR